MKPNKTPRKHAAFASSSRQMKRRPKVKSLLAVLVAFCTVCALTMPAATLEGQAQASCGLAEHTHDESCYESVLVCGQEESEGHVHDESCYEEVLTCEIPEHTHSEACWAQPETQAEAGNEENSEAVTEDGAGSDMEAAAGTETGTDTEADTGTGTGTDSSENGDAAEAGSETDSSGNAGTGAGDNGSAESGAESGDGQTGNGGAGSEADGTAENGSGTENAGEQGESTSAEDALTEADKTEQAENPQAAEEAAEMPDGATVPEGYTEQYTVRDEENGFAVTVYAPEGVVPEGAVLSAELLSEETEEYAVAEQELAAETEAVMAENGVSALSEDGADAASEDGEAAAPSYGFAALDIHFEYENGEEVEPNGDVYVVIDAAGLLPEDADPESVTVQHHAEQEDGSVTVETVADTAEETAGVVAVVENEAQAENDVQAAFEVDGFSRFTIVYSYNWNKNLSVTVVNENYVEIGEDSYSSYTTIGSEWASVATIASEIMNTNGLSADEYEFDHAEIKWQFYGSERTANVAQIKYQTGYYGYGGSFLYRTGNYGDGTSFPSKYTLYFIFNEKESGGDNPDNPGGGEVTENASVTTGKTVIDNDHDYNYELTLSVTGDRGTVSNKQKVDVLFVMDVSGSMDDTWGQHPNRESKLNSAKKAIYQISGYQDYDGLSDNDALSVRYALVTFSGSNQDSNRKWDDAKNRTSGWQDVNSLGNTVNRVYSENGTNYEAGLMIANDTTEIPASDNDTIKVVIFLSDGNPGYYYNDSGYTTGDGSPSSYNREALRQAVAQCKELDTDYFYFVGITNDVSSDVFNDMVEAVKVPASNKGAYTSSDTDELMAVFDDIQEQITFFAADHVVMTDPLSQWADIVSDSDGNVEFEVKLEKKNANGEYVQEGNTQTVVGGQLATFTTMAENESGEVVSSTFTMTPIWNSATKTIEVEFTEGYELAPGYRYSVTTTITPNESAREEGMDGYDGTGETDTGTHSGQFGFWSNDNDNAKVNYQVTGTPGSEPFPKPVVQVPDLPTGNLTITKEVAGAEVTDEDYTFTISTTNEEVAGQTYGSVTFSEDKNEEGYYTAELTISAATKEGVDGSLTIEGLPAGDYTVTEQKPGTLPGYQFISTSYEVNGEKTNSVTVVDKESAQIDVTNTYVELSDITIKKVDSDGKPLAGAKFLLYKMDGDNKLYYSKNGEVVTWVPDKSQATELTSESEGIIEVTGLTTDTTYYLVEMKAPDGYNLLEHEVKIWWEDGELKAAYADGSDNLVKDGQIVVTNSTGTELPETGGPGTTILTIGGLLLMAGAVGGGYGLRRRRGKEGR